MTSPESSGNIERHDADRADSELSGGDHDYFFHHLLVAVFIAVPLFVAIWAGLIALAARLAHFGFEGPVAMGAGVGVLAGIFWASWYAFVSYSQHEEDERH